MSTVSRSQCLCNSRIRILVALLSNVKSSVMLSSDNKNSLIIGCSLQGTVLNMFSSVFDVVRYNSDNVL